MKKLPSFKQWLKLPSVLTKKEVISLSAFFGIFVISLFFLIISFYYANTKEAPDFGGILVEGAVGAPSSINPIYAANSDVDRQLTELIFSGLLKNEGGSMVPDLAEKMPEIKDNGTTYDVYLRNNIYFHDGKKLTADDVIFTIKAIQEVEYKSPLRANWLGVKVEKINDYALRLRLKNPYPGFLERLNVKIIPMHVWSNISPSQFQFSPYNFKPIGTGPYQLKNPSSNIIQNRAGDITSIKLEAFSKYYNSAAKPHIQEIIFQFYKADKDMIWAAQTGKLDGFLLRDNQNFKSARYISYNFSLPRYFAIFFNQKKNIYLEKTSLRTALNYALDKQQLIRNVFDNRATIASSPFMPEFYGYDAPTTSAVFNIEKAKELMQKAGFESRDNKWIKSKSADDGTFKTALKQGSLGDDVKKLQTCLSTMEDKDGRLYPEDKISSIYDAATKKAVERFQEKYRAEILDPEKISKPTGQVKQMTMEKLNTVCNSGRPEGEALKISLTISDDEMLKRVAEEIKSQWEKFGVEAEINSFPLLALKQDIIGQRNYQALLFGEILGLVPDPFPFWHSSQIPDPGLNLAGYKNSDVDKLLESARQDLDPLSRREKYEKAQAFLLADMPAIFLFNPDNIYVASKNIKGIKACNISDISQIFSNANNWYIKTKRVWK